MFLIVGLPGSGKSTYAQRLKDEKNIKYHYEADMAMYEDGKYVFKRSKLPGAHAWCQVMTELAMKEKECVIVSNTFLRKKEVKPYIDLANLYEYRIHLVRMTGNYGSIHGVPSNVYERMKLIQEFYELKDFYLASAMCSKRTSNCS